MARRNRGGGAQHHTHNMRYGAIMFGRMVTALIGIMVLLMIAIALYWTQVKGESLPIRFSVADANTEPSSQPAR